MNYCRVCGKGLKDIFSLGSIYPSSFLDNPGKPKFSKEPLDLAKCTYCGLVQLSENPDIDSLYKTMYYYKSGLNSSMVNDLKDIYTSINSEIILRPNDTIIDIGCNDGTLLDFYRDDNLNKIGFDPAPNLQLVNENIYFINDYFDANKIPGIKAKVITAIAMFYDLPDPNKFVEDVKKVLHSDGIFIIQLMDLVSMLKANAFDNICHEHLEYYTLKNIFILLNNHNLSIYKVNYNKTNGGSIRIYACHSQQRYTDDHVLSYLAEESQYLNYQKKIESFKIVVDSLKYSTLDTLKSFKRAGFTTYGLGASTKGNTLLQYYKLDSNLISKIAEINSDKYYKFTVGSDIQIIPQNIALSESPDIFFILPWHFITSLTQKKEFLSFMRNGGWLFVPLPTPTIYYYELGEVRKRYV